MGGSLTAKKVFGLATRRGDPIAATVVEDEASRIALGLAVVTAVVDLELVILGGGVGNADLLLGPVERSCAPSPMRPRLAVSALGEDAVLQGAVATALAAAQRHLFDPATMLDRKEPSWSEAQRTPAPSALRERCPMRRRLIGLLALALLAVACTAGGGGDDSTPAASIDPNAQHDPLTLTVWSNFSGREFDVTTGVLQSIKQKYPWMTVKHVGGKDDAAILRAINGGTPPDMAISFTPANSARYCKTGAMQDLNPYLANDKVDKAAMWPPAIFSYTQFENVQCVLPMLTDAYGLYYNKDLLAKAGITEPPRPSASLTAAAEKLTEYNADGSIKVAGYMPLLGFYSGNTVNVYVAATTPSGTTSPASRRWPPTPTGPRCSSGRRRSSTRSGTTSCRSSPPSSAGRLRVVAHGFEQGKIAMMIDGEWRTAFIAADKSKVNYATAPPPTADDRTDLYGSRRPAAPSSASPRASSTRPSRGCWSSTCRPTRGRDSSWPTGPWNVPSTNEALAGSELASDPQFKTFMDIFGHPKSTYKTLTPIGQVDEDLFGTFGQKWQAGKVPDLQSGLEQLDTQIAKQLQLG